MLPKIENQSHVQMGFSLLATYLASRPTASDPTLVEYLACAHHGTFNTRQKAEQAVASYRRLNAASSR